VSRGGEKLAGALDAFGIDVRDLVVLDVGASTGGFTDCVLQRGARRVVTVDVGHAQLAWSLRTDARVTVLEGVNARTLSVADLPIVPTFAVVDVSFISLTLILPALAGILPPGVTVVALVKPQFEVGREQVGKGGVVRDDALRAQAVQKVGDAAVALGFVVEGAVDSALPGPKGNREIFLRLRRG
jgi:23S rRNA (cytidine1920-2'-O)/16S rRNA (cytidine1409-2'-O)-methyltransferase